MPEYYHCWLKYMYRGRFLWSALYIINVCYFVSNLFVLYLIFTVFVKVHF